MAVPAGRGREGACRRESAASISGWTAGSTHLYPSRQSHKSYSRGQGTVSDETRDFYGLPGGPGRTLPPRVRRCVIFVVLLDFGSGGSERSPVKVGYSLDEERGFRRRGEESGGFQAGR